MNVAVPWCQHSPMFGQFASSQTVCRPRSAHQPLEAVVVLGAGRAHLQPVGLGLPRQRVGSGLAAPDEGEWSGGHAGCQTLNYTTRMAALSITWLGHSTFIITTPGGKRIVTDPWLDGNPACPADRKRIDAADLILLSHGHSDHSGDVVARGARDRRAGRDDQRGAALAARQKGVKNVHGMNFGGSISIAGLQIALVPAVHTSSVVENDATVYLGEPAGFVVTLENGQRVLLRRRHRALRRHAAHRASCTRPRSRSCRSATTTRWARTPRPRPARCSASARSCRCTTARSRS